MSIRVDLVNYRDASIKELAILLHGIVNNPTQVVESSELEILSNFVSEWKAAARAIEPRKDWWVQNLPDDVRNAYKTSEHYIHILNALYGPRTT